MDVKKLKEAIETTDKKIVMLSGYVKDRNAMKGCLKTSSYFAAINDCINAFLRILPNECDLEILIRDIGAPHGLSLSLSKELAIAVHNLIQKRLKGGEKND